MCVGVCKVRFQFTGQTAKMSHYEDLGTLSQPQLSSKLDHQGSPDPLLNDVSKSLVGELSGKFDRLQHFQLSPEVKIQILNIPSLCHKLLSLQNQVL